LTSRRVHRHPDHGEAETRQTSGRRLVAADWRAVRLGSIGSQARWYSGVQVPTSAGFTYACAPESFDIDRPLVLSGNRRF
jgi:hypothetical protein